MERRPRGELEAEVMNVLWSSDDWMTPREVQESVSSTRRPLAYTTVMTILVRLLQKGMLQREESGRGFAYRAVAGRDEWSAQRMHEVLAQSSDPRLTLNHFVESMTPKEARLLRRSLDERRHA